MYMADKCRCDACREANRVYAEHLAHARVLEQWHPESTRFVDAEPVRAHIRALQHAGCGWKRAARLAGVSPSTMSRLLYGKRQRTRRVLADKILGVKDPALAGHALVDATGTRRRLQALVAQGWSQTELARRLGFSRHNMPPLIHGHQPMVTVDRATAVHALWRELWTRNPPPGDADRNRRRAARLGWVSTLAWDNIDDPKETPVGRTPHGMVQH